MNDAVTAFDVSSNDFGIVNFDPIRCVDGYFLTLNGFGRVELHYISSLNIPGDNVVSKNCRQFVLVLRLQ